VIRVSAEVHANYFNTKYVEVNLSAQSGVTIRGLHLTLSEAFKLHEQLGLALKDAEYPKV
jgi:hypothetical protein